MVAARKKNFVDFGYHFNNGTGTDRDAFSTAGTFFMVNNRDSVTAYTESVEGASLDTGAQTKTPVLTDFYAITGKDRCVTVSDAVVYGTFKSFISAALAMDNRHFCFGGMGFNAEDFRNM
jgi:hypothetical protein